jgi:hypothetical protein
MSRGPRKLSRYSAPVNGRTAAVGGDMGAVFGGMGVLPQLR